jgi:Uma2 family endonuclease
VFCVLARRSRTRQVDMGGPRQVYWWALFCCAPLSGGGSTSPEASGQPNNSSGDQCFVTSVLVIRGRTRPTFPAFFCRSFGCASFVPGVPTRANAKARQENQAMSASSETIPGFSDRSQEPIADIPTETEAFLRWAVSLDRHHPFKYELSRGKFSRMMIHVSRAHWLVTANLLGELFLKLDRSRFQAGPAEFGVRTGVGVRYPDVLVDRVSSSLADLACEAPVFIVEVLSPSTAGRDFTVKLQEYTGIASVQTYLICSQDEPRAWVWARRDDGSWPNLPTELAGREGTISLGGLDAVLSMAAIFRGIPDAPTVE